MKDHVSIGVEKRLRFALLDDERDITDVVYLAREFHEESRFGYIRFAPEKVEAIARSVLQDPAHQAIMVCRERGEMVGALHCSAGEYNIGKGVIVSTFHSLFVLPRIRKTLLSGRVTLGLMRGVEKWSQARGAKEILFHATSDIDLERTHTFIQRLGYRFIGGSYVRVSR